MLEKMGWDSSKGLGPQSEGRMEPVATVFRRDKTGIGHRKETPRITHFPPHNEREAAQSKDGLSESQRKFIALVSTHFGLVSHHRR